MEQYASMLFIYKHNTGTAGFSFVRSKIVEISKKRLRTGINKRPEPGFCRLSGRFPAYLFLM